MLLNLRFYGKFVTNTNRSCRRLLSSTDAAVDDSVDDDGETAAGVEAEVPVGPNEDGTFRVLEIPGLHRREFRREGNPVDGFKRRLFPPAEPRYKKMMPESAKWTNIWPSAQSFKWSVVPLPVRQGYVKSGQAVVPSKYANAELMKIPNFFHLTPEHIRKHCSAIKQFCTPWPVELNSDAKCRELFPVEISTSTYCHAGPSIRHPNARKVTMRVPLNSLGFLDFHAKDKLLRLLGPRYDPSNDLITIITDRCPTSRQNYDYAHYLLTAVYFESWKIEEWERNKSQEDLGKYYWHLSVSRKRAVEYVKLLAKDENWPLPRFTGLSKTPDDVEIVRHPIVDDYHHAVSDLVNNGESEDALKNYRSAVERLLGLSESQN